jgi:mannose-6-phosphate isomerase-like protein (cupin superfamily)
LWLAKVSIRCASPGGIGYAKVRFFGKASPNEPGKPFVLSAFEIANTFANGSSQIIQRARTFAIAYSIYAGNWGDWEEHPYLGHIYFVRSGHAAAELGGQLQNAKEDRASTIVGNGATGAQRFEIGPGDIVVIPQNTPHHMDLSSERLEYILVLVRNSKTE